MEKQRMEIFFSRIEINYNVIIMMPVQTTAASSDFHAGATAGRCSLFSSVGAAIIESLAHCCRLRKPPVEKR